MPPEITAFLASVWSFLAWGLLQPYAAIGVGCFVAGFAIGASKQRTAFTELGRGVFFGLVAGGFVALVQLAVSRG